jgi:hypothetical protein
MTTRQKRVWSAAAGVGALVLGAGAWLALRSPPPGHRARLPEGVVTVGQTPRPRVEAQIPDTWQKARAQVAETMKTAPERLSPGARLEPFDKAGFEHDPEAYLSRIEPARCYQSAKPGPDTPVLDAVSPLRTSVTWRNATALWVKTVPNAPATFTAFGGGYFTDNGVGTVSVRADARGLAVAHFTADPGIAGDVSVIVASPVAAGTQRFYIRVKDDGQTRASNP